MNENAFEDLYKLFVNAGYRKSKEDFTLLLNENEQAYNDAFSLFTEAGYQKGEAEFAELIGIENPLKKKENPQASQQSQQEPIMDSSLVDGSSVSQGSDPQQQATQQEATQEYQIPEQIFPVEDMDAQNSDAFVDLDPETGMITPKVFPQDTRSDDYVAPPLPMYPDESTLKYYDKQTFADLAYTQEQRDKDAAMAATEKYFEDLAETERKKLQEQTRINIVEEEEFQNALSTIDKNLIDQEQEAVIPFLKEQFKGYGFTFQQLPGTSKYAGIGDAMIVTAPNGKTHKVDLDPFTSATEVAESQGLRQFMTNNATLKPNAEPTDAISKAFKARDIRKTGRRNADGSLSTVKFTSYEEDGKHYVIPTLFPKDTEGEYNEGAGNWMELPFENARKVAIERGEVFEFDTEAEAQAFAEGGWKDVDTSDLEAKNFYEKRGLDYNREKKILDEYTEATDVMYFLDPDRDGLVNSVPFSQDNLTDEQANLIKGKESRFYIDGRRREDIDVLLKEAEQVADRLSDSFLAEDTQLAREEFDLYLNKRHQQEIGGAIRLNEEVKAIENNIIQQSVGEFGVEPKSLIGVDFTDPNKRERAEKILQKYDESQVYKQFAAEKYYRANTYYDMKHNKNATKEFADNLEGFTTEVMGGLSRGNAGDVILAGAMFPEALAGYDLTDPESADKMAAKLVSYLQEEPDKVARVMSRYSSARTSEEVRDAIFSNPMEWATVLAGSSLSQMLPYGSKIVASTTLAGAGTGAALGSQGFLTGPTGALTTAGGAIAGATWGFRTGMAATSFAMEYTNEMMAAIQDYCAKRGSSSLDPQMVSQALQTQDVWDEGRRRGFARGIPIAAMDLITARLAGNMLKVGTVASTGKKVAAQLAERAIADPLGEGIGEMAAQIAVGDEINWKEIYAEMGGAVGNNSSNMIINLAGSTISKNNIEKASLLTDLGYIADETTSGTRISEWGNNMERLGQITPEENQRIQENVGLRKTAQELLSTGRFGKIFQGKEAKALTKRVMQLLSAKAELSSTTNRKELFGKTISEINNELNEIVTTKKLKPINEQTVLANTGVLGVDEQANTSDVRSGLPSYTIKKGRLKKSRQVSKKEFLDYLNGLDTRNLLKINASVRNDEEVSEILTKKVMDARIEAETESKADQKEQAPVTIDESVDVVEGAVESTPETVAENIEETVAEDGVSSKTLEDTEAVVDNQESAEATEEVELTEKQEEEVEVKTTDKTEGIQDLVGQEITLTDDLLNNAETRTVVSVNEVRSESLKRDWTRITLDNGVVVNITTDRAMNKTYKVPKSKLGVVEGQPQTKPSRKRKTKEEIRKSVEERKAKRQAAEAEAKAEAEAEVTEDVEIDEDVQQSVDDLKTLIEGDQTEEGGQAQFQLDLDKDSKKDKRLLNKQKKRKKEMAKRAAELMKDEPISDKPFDVNKPAKLHSVTIKDNKALVNKTKEMSINELVGKKINLAMADQLKVDEKRMGGPFFPLIPELFGQIAWASIDRTAAMNIVRGAVKSDATVVYNMNPTAIDSNLVTLDTLIEKVKQSPDSELLFQEMMKDILSKTWGKDGKMSPKVHGIAENARTIDEFAEDFAELDVDTKASIFTKTLPSRKVDAETTVGKMFQAEGISQESIREENIEQYVSDLPMGALTTVLEITDSNGNPVTEDTIEDAIIEGREAIAEAGFPVHRNYPVYIRGRVKGILTETAPIWSALPDFKDTMDLKIAEVLKQREKYTITVDGKKMIVKVSNNPNKTRTFTLENKDGKEVKKFKGEPGETVIKASSKTKTETLIKKIYGAEVTKVENIDKTFTSKAAESAAIRSASMRAGTAFDVTTPVELQYKQFLDRLSSSFPGVEVVKDQETFDDMLANLNIDKFSKNTKLTTKNQTVYGFVYDGKVYLNPSLKDYNAAIHEFGHIWLNVAKELNPEAYQKGLALIEEDSTYVQEVESNKEYQRVIKNMVKRGATDEQVREYILNEALATAIGDKGESFVNESVERNFKNWLNDLFDFVKKLVGISKLSSEQIQDLSLQDFLEGVVADVLSENEQFKGAQVKALNDEVQFMTTPSTPSIESVVEIARRNRIGDDATRVVLRDMGFKPKAISKALEVKIDLVTKMPREFGNVEGGATVGVQLFNEVREELNAYAIEGPRGGRGRRGVLTKTMAQVREKALEIIKNNPIYQAQDSQVQMELINSFDRVLGIRKNPNVTKQIAAIRAKLKERKIAVKDLFSAQREMRIAIRKMLPVSKYLTDKDGNSYSKSALNAVMKIVNETNVKNFKGQIYKAMGEVEAQRLKLRNRLIVKMQDLVIAKAKTAKTDSGKKRSKGLDAIGQSYFAEVKKVLNAAIKKDAEAMLEIQESVNEDLYNAGMEAIEEGRKPNRKQQQMIDRQIALDSFADVLTMELEEVEALFEDVTLTKAESIARFNNRRESRKGVTDFLKTVANEQMKADFSEMYDSYGNPLGQNELDTRRERIISAFRLNGVFAGLKEWGSQFISEGRKYKANGLTKFFYNNLAHLGTIVNILDRGKDGFFTNFFYDNLNIMDENTLQGVRRTTNVINGITESVVGKSWMDWKYSLGTDVHQVQMINSKTGNIYMNAMNKDQAMRIIALSMNDVQRSKLEAQGITEEKLNNIKGFVGKDQVKIIERVVDFLSNDYFEQTNAVYSQVNDVNLNYVENYFPTQTLSQSNVTSAMLGEADIQKIFTADFSPALKERTDQASDIKLGLSFTDVLEEHTKTMEKYKAYALGVKEMDTVLRDEGIKNLLSETGTGSVFKLALNYAINPDAGPESSKVNTAIDVLQRKFTGFALAFKLIQIPKQATSFIQAYDKYAGGKTKIPGAKLLGFTVDYLKVLAMLRSEIKEAREISATFDNRILQGLEGDILGLESGTRTFKKGRADQGRRGKISRGFQKAAGIATVAGDIIGVLGYKAVYNRAKRDGVSDAEALRLFNNYNATQQTRRATEKNQLQQSRSWMARFFTTFGSTLFLQQNQVYQSMNSMLNDISRKKFPSSKDIKTFALNYAVANVLFTMASYSATLINGNSDDRDRAWKAIRDALYGKNLIYQLPIVGAALETMENKISGSRKPVSEGVNPLMSLFYKVSKAYDGLSAGSVVKTSQPFVEIMLGAQLDSPIALLKLLGGDTEQGNVLQVLGISKSYRPGYGKKKGSSKKTSPKKTISKSEFKALDPETFDELYGEGSDYYEAQEAVREINQEIKDDLEDALK